MTKVNRKRLVELYLADVPMREIADEFGVGIGTLNDALYRLRRAGHDIPRRSEVHRARLRDARRSELPDELVRRIEALLDAIDEGPRTARHRPARECAEQVRRWLDGYF